MKKYFLIALIVCCLQSVFAKQTVSYIYKALSEEGCGISFNIIRNSDGDYLIVSLTADNIILDDNPELKLKFFNGKVLTINGEKQGQINQTALVNTGYVIPNTSVVSGVSVPVTTGTSIAKFPITQEQIEMFPLGVQKIRISSVPIVHERVFKKDKIGAKIYQLYLNASNAEDF